MIDKLTIIRKKALQFRNARDWKQFHNPKNLAEAICIESAELLEKFLWTTPKQSCLLDDKKVEEIEEEVADVMIFLIYLCEALNIDLSDAVERKIAVNEKKYPVDKAKGSSKKYREL